MTSLSIRRTRRVPLRVSLMAALSLMHQPHPVLAAEVQNCGDGGPGSGSLRDVITNAASGDTIDLSQLPAKCGMFNSVVTLSNGEIGIAQDNLKLQGPSVGSVTVKVAEPSDSRILNHYGTGLLAIYDMKIEGGKVYRPGALAAGGCVASSGTVLLSRTAVSGCMASGFYGMGGGVYAKGSLSLLDSTISANTAYGSGAGNGGGAFVRASLLIRDSTISGNTASSVGGGAYVYVSGGGSVNVKYSTIDSNSARSCGGAALQVTSTLSNTTISNNTASDSFGGLCLYDGQSQMTNSTVASNTAAFCTGGIGLGLGSLDLQSSIVALNNSTLCAADLYLYSGSAGVTGSDNLIVSADSSVPASAIKLTADPQLGPLQFNGGKTQTRALLQGSPAIGVGNNNGNLNWDERGTGYPRASGPGVATDIGAFQFDSIFFSDLEH